jgi:hypothetical protein
VKPSAFLDDASGSGAVVDAVWGDDGELHVVAEPDQSDAGRPAPRCLVCGKPGMRYNAKVHPGACRREQRRRTQ